MNHVNNFFLIFCLSLSAWNETWVGDYWTGNQSWLDFNYCYHHSFILMYMYIVFKLIISSFKVLVLHKLVVLEQDWELVLEQALVRDLELDLEQALVVVLEQTNLLD